jgi:hypothetical protein
MKLTAGKLVKCMLPHGLVVLPEVIRLRSAAASERAHLANFAVNATLRDRHKGARCFILCTGPSVKAQDLRRLAGELVISVSNAYLHPDYNLVRPTYHCVPQITYGKLTPERAAAWLADMDKHIGGAEIVLSGEERTLVASHGIFRDRRVHYLHLEGDAWGSDADALPDLTGRLPIPQSVPIMASMLALYMGCTDIYLLGTDHDHFLTGSYTHFYDRSLVTGTDISVGGDGRITTSRYEDFHALGRLWRQYRRLGECARRHGVTIRNATAGGALDEFERVDYNTLRLAGDGKGKGATEGDLSRRAGP